LGGHRRTGHPGCRRRRGVAIDLSLVIFDCDGVLVDSELITNRVFAEMLGELGLAFTTEDMFERFVGRSMTQCCETIAGLLNRPVPAGFVAQYQARSTAALHAQITAVAGIEDCLAALEARGVPYCVASNGTQEKMRTTLAATGLWARFEGRRFSIADVLHGKPAPDLFLHAAGHYRIAPNRCCVIEDTPTGVIAGLAAGMTVYGYAARTPARRLLEAGAHHTFSDMRQLPSLLFAA
jgi:HAD superfamily hydrolase (TIGR01509 family)